MIHVVRPALSRIKWRLRRLGPGGLFLDWTRRIRRPDLSLLHAELHAIYDRERSDNPRTYNPRGKVYQSYRRIELFSSDRFEAYAFSDGRIMAVEDRIERYGLPDFVRHGSRVLDIGANSGLLSIELALRGATVDAVERNPILIEAGRRVAAFLGVEGVRFHAVPFHEFPPFEPYDVVLCLSAFFTHDQHERSSVETYFGLIDRHLKPGGRLVFLTTAYGCGEFESDQASNEACDWIRRHMRVLKEEPDPLHHPFENCHKTFLLAEKRSS